MEANHLPRMRFHVDSQLQPAMVRSLLVVAGVLGILKQAWKEFLQDECQVRAAALAYYTIFALPPLLVLLLMVAGVVWDPRDIQQAMETQFAGLVGAEGGRAIHQMIAQADAPGRESVITTILGAAGLLFGAT